MANARPSSQMINACRTSRAMTPASIAPCGIICDICLGFQREKNRCVGCQPDGNKVFHCEKCSIKLCTEKGKNVKTLCSKCLKFPCRRIKNLDKRYSIKYGESVIENLQAIERIGIREFVKQQKAKWTCPHCGKLVCVHRDTCQVCGTKNEHFPANAKAVS